MPAPLPTPARETQAPRPAATPKQVETPLPQRVSSLGRERTVDSADYGRLANIERNRRGPDGDYRVILGLPKLLRPAEQLYEDSNALSASLRTFQMPGTSYPVNFTRVYESPDASGEFVRGNGAVFVTYPYSEYTRTKDEGMKAQMPQGALFHIGMPLSWRARPPQQPAAYYTSSARLEGRIDLRRYDALEGRVELQTDGNGESTPTPRSAVIGSPDAAPRPPESLPPIVSDESYRRAFFDELLTGK